MIIVLHLYVHVLSRCHNDGWFLFFLRSLSHSLNSLRRHRESLSSDSAPPTAPRAQNGENPVVSATTSSSALQGRVKVLEDHNSKLENVISELKRVTEPVCVLGRERGEGGRGEEGGGREGGREGGEREGREGREGGRKGGGGRGEGGREGGKGEGGRGAS